MKELRLANKIITTLIKDRVHYPDRLIVDTLTTIGRCGVLLLLYRYVFDLHQGTINNTPFIIAAWSMFFYFSFSVLRLRDIAKAIMQDVQSGTVEILLNKPISYLAYRMWWQVGSGLYSFLVISIVGTILMILFVGIPSTMTTPFFFSTLFLAYILGMFLSLLLYSIVGLLAFWIEEVRPVFWMVDKSVMILGGSYLPVALFPSIMYKLAVWSPFGASQFITHTVNDSWQTHWYEFMGIQLFWIAILGTIMYFLFNKARQRLSVNGG